MLIVFVYDLINIYKGEDADPASAVLYFHPKHVSEQQKAVLSGQLVGVAHCIQSVFGRPKIISLHQCRFFLVYQQDYFIAVGVDHNANDWILEQYSNTILQLIEFLHGSLALLRKRTPDLKQFSTKLYRLFETYLKYPFIGASSIPYVPSFNLPKSAGVVFVEAVQVLQNCLMQNHVLGGAVLYRNKVIASQLDGILTRKLLITDPQRIRCPANVPTTDFDVPCNAQLLYVYLTQSEYQKLSQESVKFRNLTQCFTKLTSLPKMEDTSSIATNGQQHQTFLSTVAEEEEINHVEEPDISATKKRNRPKFLNLKTKTTDSLETAATVPHSTNIICSTPLEDLKPPIHTQIMSICRREDNDSLVLPKVSPEFSGTTRKLSSSCLNIHQTNGDFQRLSTLQRHKTITDPIYPLFKANGNVASPSYLMQAAQNSISNARRTPSNRKKPVTQSNEVENNVIRDSSKHRSGLFTPLDWGGLANALPTFPLVKNNGDAVVDQQDSAEKCVLFLYGQHDMILVCVLQEDGVTSKELISSLWSIARDYLKVAEPQVNHYLEVCSIHLNQPFDAEKYSFFYTNCGKDDSSRSGGLWNADNLQAMVHSHVEFDWNADLMEIIARNSDGVMYCYRCGGTEAYYFQPVPKLVSLPPPTDLLANIQLKAKRRLEIDHHIVLL